MTTRGKLELLFLHALPLDGSMWAAQKQLLPNSTYTPTLYPFGDSIQAWAAAALNIAKSHRLVVVGCSVGGSCALELAVMAPDRVAALVLIGTEAEHRPDPALHASTLETLQALISAHSRTISYESIDVLLDRPPALDLATLQRKMIAGGRGGYCFEQNMLFRGGLRSLGYKVMSLQARVVGGLEIDAPRPMLHMVLRVELPEGRFLVDVGFGNWHRRAR